MKRNIPVPIVLRPTSRLAPILLERSSPSCDFLPIAITTLVAIFSPATLPTRSHDPHWLTPHWTPHHAVSADSRCLPPRCLLSLAVIHRRSTTTTPTLHEDLLQATVRRPPSSPSRLPRLQKTGEVRRRQCSIVLQSSSAGRNAVCQEERKKKMAFLSFFTMPTAS
nr:hypothetical protein Iba_chr09dCG13700 [Ipomoea batatas]